jgi:hypothetical protein
VQASTFLWCPAPAAAGTAVDKLAVSRIKRMHLLHIFLCPRLLTNTWCKRLYRVSDLVVKLPSGHHPAWPTQMHEPLILVLTLPFLAVCPWQLRNTPPVLELGRTLCRMWQDPQGDVGGVLCQLCHLLASLDSMSAGMVRELLYSAPPGQVLPVLTS